MTDVPERIWAGLRGCEMTTEARIREQEYIREDLYTAAIAKRDALRAEVERLRKAAARAIDHLDEGMGLEARRCLRIALGDSKQ